MTIEYQDVGRKFAVLSEEDLAKVDVDVERWRGFERGGLDWIQVVEVPRALIIASGGAGKSSEMLEHHLKLVEAGKYG